MAFSYNNVGKQCVLDVSTDNNINNYKLGTIIGYYHDSTNSEEYYTISVGSNGNCVLVDDDTSITILS
jgi:hypothetical protein